MAAKPSERAPTRGSASETCTRTLREVIGENTGWLVKFKFQIKVLSKCVLNIAWDILM